MSGLHKQSKNKRGRVDMASPVLPDIPTYDGPTDVYEQVDTPWPRDGMEFQIIDRQTRATAGGHLVDIAVMLQTRPEGSDEGWVTLARLDCANGFVHIDEGNNKHNTALVPPSCRTDLEAARRHGLEYCWDVDRRLQG